MLQEIIKVTYEGEKALVSARELHEFLESKERFSKWFEKMLGYGFELNEDYYIRTFIHHQNKQELIDYYISLEMVLRKLKHIKFNPKASLLEKYLYKEININYIFKESKRKEIQFGDMLDKITGMKWQRQYPIDRGKYRLDFYLKDVLIVEYDELYHTYQEKYDLERISYCREWLANNEGDGDKWRCPVIRVKEGEELVGLNRIIRHIAGFEMFDTQYDYKLQVCDIGNKTIHI